MTRNFIESTCRMCEDQIDPEPQANKRQRLELWQIDIKEAAVVRVDLYSFNWNLYVGPFESGNWYFSGSFMYTFCTFIILSTANYFVFTQWMLNIRQEFQF